MTNPVQLNINAKGHRYLEVEPVEKGSGTVGEPGGISAKTLVLYTSAKANLHVKIDVGAANTYDGLLEVDTVGAGGNAITLVSAAGSGVNVGELTVGANALAWSFKTTVSKFSDFEAQFPKTCTFGIVYVKRPSATPNAVFTAVDDEFTAKAFKRGGDVGLLYVFDGLEDSCADIVGVSDAAAILAATATYYKLNGIITDAVGLTVGEVWAKDDATLVPHASLTASKYSKRMGVAKSATEAQLADGEVFLISTP